jgi:hypothetical protein
VPAEQVVQLVDPGGAAVPARQATQVAALVAWEAVDAVPPGHKVQEPAPLVE